MTAIDGNRIIIKLQAKPAANELYLNHKQEQMEKKLLMLISTREDFACELQERLPGSFELHIIKNVHSGYTLAMSCLPDMILLDHSSLASDSLGKLSNFKSNHFLSRTFLAMYAEEEVKQEVENIYKEEIDLFLYDSLSYSKICEAIETKMNSRNTVSNYWKDSFMGLFNLMLSPVILLQNEKILAMNDAFKKAFYLNDRKDLKITDLVNCSSKNKVISLLRNFARGKAMRASTKANLLIKSDKTRSARIYFSKLDKMVCGQFMMMISFSENQSLLNENVGMDMLNRQDPEIETPVFTQREKEVIELLCNGYKTREIATLLCVSEKTVEKHRSHIIKKTNSDNILESVIYALNHNLIELQRT